MRASELRRQIVIQHASRVKDDFGSDVSTWATLATVYAKIEPLTGREFFAANEIVEKVSHRFIIRYLSTVTTQMRVSYDSRIFNITSVVDPEEKNKVTVLLAEETS